MDALGWTCRHEYWPRLEPCLTDTWQTCAELAARSGLGRIYVNYAMALAAALDRVQTCYRDVPKTKRGRPNGYYQQVLYRRKSSS